MIIILAVLALVVVNALADSPWGVFSIGLTIPIALFMGSTNWGGFHAQVLGFNDLRNRFCLVDRRDWP